MVHNLLARKTRSFLFTATETLWALGFSIAGRLLPVSVEHWDSPGQLRVLAVAPHPDDEAIGCAGTLALHQKRGDVVCIAYITDGRSSRALVLGPEQMALRRKREAQTAAMALGVDRVEWFGLPEGDWTEEQLQSGLQALLHQFSPDLIYAPSRVDFHAEHRRVAHALAAVLACASAPSSSGDEALDGDNHESDPAHTTGGLRTDLSPGHSSGQLPSLMIRIYQVQIPLTPVLTNLVAPTSGVGVETAAALNAYSTQVDNVPRALRQRRYAARFYGLKDQAEEFWQMTADQYCRLHRQAPDDRPVTMFRGLRSGPFTDPLAYLQGRSERWRLAALVRRDSGR